MLLKRGLAHAHCFYALWPVCPSVMGVSPVQYIHKTASGDVVADHSCPEQQCYCAAISRGPDSPASPKHQGNGNVFNWRLVTSADVSNPCNLSPSHCLMLHLTLMPSVDEVELTCRLNVNNEQASSRMHGWSRSNSSYR